MAIAVHAVQYLLLALLRARRPAHAIEPAPEFPARTQAQSAHRSRSASACPGLPSGPERSALARPSPMPLPLATQVHAFSAKRAKLEQLPLSATFRAALGGKASEPRLVVGGIW